MFLTKFFLKRSCQHDKITPDLEFGYCPDCGKLICNEWYITRCKCCGVKLKAIVKNGVVEPQGHYCANCGSNEFEVEKIDKINFIDINFAVLLKKEYAEIPDRVSTSRCWQEKTASQQKLLVQYL